MELSGNTILITGATSGIGLAFAESLLSLGNQVIVCGRRQDRLEQLQEQYPGIIATVCDLQDEDQRVGLAQWLVEEYPDLNMLINNAGIQLATDLTQPVSLERVRGELETNFVAPLHLASLLTPHLSTQPDAAIVNISSGLAFVPLAEVAVYSATKAAVHSLCLSMRYQLRDTSIRVFEIAPPAVDTELGSETWEEGAVSHGGIPVAEFLEEALESLRNDEFEAAIGMSRWLRNNLEAGFKELNP
jgi:uncharacterized oxidoreductase